MRNQPKTYHDCKGSGARIQVHQGGTRSGKTYSILQVLAEFCYLNPNRGYVITICRKTFPSLRASALKDFIEILNANDWYRVENHNKSTQEYYLFGNTIEFISVDQPQKVRGRKRDILYINEANEINLEDWRQLILRTTQRIIIDYNPSDEFHWIYDQVIPRTDSEFFKTTYKDNPFLDQITIDEIERLKDVDENFWNVFGLGERGRSRATIFTNYTEIDQVPEGDGWKLWRYGLDFGFSNDPTAISAVYTNGVEFCLDEICYATEMGNADIAKVFRDLPQVPIIADNAEPKSIRQIKGFGFNIQPCIKGPDSVRAGIGYMKSKKIFVTSRSVNGIKEFRNYKYHEDKNGRITNVPVDKFNHFIDATRYAMTWKMLKANYGKYVIG